MKVLSKVAEAYAFYMQHASEPPTHINISAKDLKKLLIEKPEALDGDKFMGLILNVAEGNITVGRSVEI
jgi:hypothetical protein